MFTVSQEVRVVPNLRVGLKGGVFINLQMSELAGQIRNITGVRETDVGGDTLYNLEESPYLWPSSALMDPSAPIPEEPVVEVEPEAVLPFNVGDLVRISDLSEEIFGRHRDDFNAGYVGTMQTMIGQEAVVTDIVEASSNRGFYVSMRDTSFSWDNRALTLVATREQLIENEKKVKKLLNPNNLYRVYFAEQQAICKAFVSNNRVTASACHDGRTILNMTYAELLTHIEARTVKVICMEKNVR